MWRIVDIASDHRHLRLEKAALMVCEGKEVLGRIPLDEINGIVLHGHGCTLTTEILSACAQTSIPVTVCDRRHQPISLAWPMVGQYEQSDRIDAQVAATDRLKNRLWRDVVRAKLREQARVLDLKDSSGAAAMKKLLPLVKAGDPDNIEARGARFYWSRLMGDSFIRDPDGTGVNGALNYGYTILRSAMARSVASTGLHPALSLFHIGKRNPFRLVDDLMEPFRPIVDRCVMLDLERFEPPLSAEARQDLAGLIRRGISHDGTERPVHRVMDLLAFSLSEVFLGHRTDLDLPSVIAGEWQGDLLEDPDD